MQAGRGGKGGVRPSLPPQVDASGRRPCATAAAASAAAAASGGGGQSGLGALALERRPPPSPSPFKHVACRGQNRCAALAKPSQWQRQPCHADGIAAPLRPRRAGRSAVVTIRLSRRRRPIARLATPRTRAQSAAALPLARPPAPVPSTRASPPAAAAAPVSRRRPGSPASPARAQRPQRGRVRLEAQKVGQHFTRLGGRGVLAAAVPAVQEEAQRCAYLVVPAQDLLRHARHRRVAAGISTHVGVAVAGGGGFRGGSVYGHCQLASRGVAAACACMLWSQGTASCSAGA